MLDGVKYEAIRSTSWRGGHRWLGDTTVNLSFPGWLGSCNRIAGYVARSDGDAGVSFHYEWWLPLGILLAGMLCVPIGLAVRKRWRQIGWGLMIGGPIVAVLFATLLFTERVLVHERGFEFNTSIFGVTARSRVAFDSV